MNDYAPRVIKDRKFRDKMNDFPSTMKESQIEKMKDESFEHEGDKKEDHRKNRADFDIESQQTKKHEEVNVNKVNDQKIKPQSKDSQENMENLKTDQEQHQEVEEQKEDPEIPIIDDTFTQEGNR